MSPLTRQAHEAALAEWRATVSAGTTFEGAAALAEEEARAILEEGGPAAAESATLVLKKLAYAREALVRGDVSGFGRWAFAAGQERATMWAIASTAADARQRLSETRATVTNAEHERWRAEARAIWVRRPDMKATDVARLVRKKLGLDVDVDTIRKKVRTEKPGAG
ncbi:MAG: hypothetical protein ACHP7N_11350 [Caulobacterales bacterium]